MKYLIALFLLISLCFLSGNSLAMVPKIDSVYADSVYGTTLSDIQTKASLGKPDKNFTTLGNAALVDLMFRNHANTGVVTIKPNATLLVWGKKDQSVDSSAGQVVFYKTDPDGAILYNSKPFILGDSLNVIPVPNLEFSYVEISLAEPDAHAVNFAKSYLLDAVAIVEDTTPPSAVHQVTLANLISSYPNPFIGNTKIHLDQNIAGEVQLLVVDALGREVDRFNEGFLESGSHEIPLAIKAQGFYFVRLFINGQPFGSPLKITSR